MKALFIALNDLRRIATDRRMAAFLLAMPVVMTVFMGLMLGSAEGADPRLPVALVVEDPDDPAAATLRELLALSAVIRPADEGAASADGSGAAASEGVPEDAAGIPHATESAADPDARLAAAREDVRAGRLAAAVHVPAGWGASVLTGRPGKLELLIDSGSTAGHAAKGAVQAVVTRLLSSAESARIAVALAGRDAPADPGLRTVAAGPGAAGGAQANVAQANVAPTDVAQADPAAVADLLGASVDLWMTPAWRIEAEPETALSQLSGYAQSSPGMIVMFAIFGLVTTAMLLVSERRSLSLKRLVATGVGPGAILGGHFLALTAVVLVQELVLVAFGQLALGVDYLHAPGAVALVTLALAAWVASVGLLVGTLAKSEEQVTVVSFVLMFVLAGLGGALFPLEVSSSGFAAAGSLTPAGQAMSAFQAVLLRGRGLGDVLGQTAIIAAWTVPLLGVAVWRFRPE